MSKPIKCLLLTVCAILIMYDSNASNSFIFLWLLLGAVIILYTPPQKQGIMEIDKMTGKEFEEYLLKHFRKKGYKAELTPESNDYGADLVLKKGSKRIVVQAKRYKGKVGNKAIQEVVAAKPYYKAGHAMVITNSYYTPNAKNLARANKVELWDRDKLRKEFVKGA